MLYRRFPGCRKRRSAHTTVHGRCQGAQRVAGHPRVQRRSAPAGYPACRGRDDASCLLRCQKDLWYPNQPYRPRALSQEEESTVGRGRPRGICPGPGPLIGQTRGRWPDAVLHGPRAVHLHPARILIIRVLPRAESATGCIFRQLPIRELAPFISKAGISEAFAGRCVQAPERAEVRRKEAGKQVKYRTCRFFSVFSTQRWWRFQAFR